jgi:uncharacterized Rmd1/YagE family protein
MDKVISYQISDRIDIKGFRPLCKAVLIYGDADELFYESGPEKYVYVFKYGTVSFFGFGVSEISDFLQTIKPFCKTYFAERLHDEFIIESGAKEDKVSYNKISIISAERKVLQIIMLNVSQSVALDYYSELTSQLLEDTNRHTEIMERRGRLAISGKNLKKFIGKTLLLKNTITANLYIFDTPDAIWEDERLDKLYTELKKNLDLADRFRSVTEGLGIVKDNLELFKDTLQYRNSIFLEWVIIVLIAIEVIHFIAEELF